MFLIRLPRRSAARITVACSSGGEYFAPRETGYLVRCPPRYRAGHILCHGPVSRPPDYYAQAATPQDRYRPRLITSLIEKQPRQVSSFIKHRGLTSRPLPPARCAARRARDPQARGGIILVASSPRSNRFICSRALFRGSPTCTAGPGDGFNKRLGGAHTANAVPAEDADFRSDFIYSAVGGLDDSRA